MEINIKHFIIHVMLKEVVKIKMDKTYQDGKVHSVTVLNNPKNRTKKNHQVLQVFRKGKE